jgi:hypothetical protein
MGGWMSGTGIAFSVTQPNSVRNFRSRRLTKCAFSAHWCAPPHSDLAARLLQAIGKNSKELRRDEKAIAV